MFRHHRDFLNPNVNDYTIVISARPAKRCHRAGGRKTRKRFSLAGVRENTRADDE